MISKFYTNLLAKRDEINKDDKGFTLIELLVVVIIIGILAAVAIPIYIGVQNNAKDSSVKSDIANAKTATVAYYAATQSATAPSLTATSLGDYGFTKGDTTSAMVYKGTTTATSFTICATSTSGKFFQVTSGSSAITEPTSCA